jgi:hypothetical protein
MAASAVEDRSVGGWGWSNLEVRSSSCIYTGRRRSSMRRMISGTAAPGLQSALSLAGVWQARAPQGGASRGDAAASMLPGPVPPPPLTPPSAVMLVQRSLRPMYGLCHGRDAVTREQRNQMTCFDCYCRCYRHFPFFSQPSGFSVFPERRSLSPILNGRRGHESAPCTKSEDTAWRCSEGQ